MFSEGERDLLIRIDEKLDNLLLTFADHVAASERTHTDFNKRVTSLERWKWGWASAIALLVLLMNLFSEQVSHWLVR